MDCGTRGKRLRPLAGAVHYETTYRIPGRLSTLTPLQTVLGAELTRQSLDLGPVQRTEKVVQAVFQGGEKHVPHNKG